MKAAQFESLLDTVVDALQRDVRSSKKHHAPNAFENRVREVLQGIVKGTKIAVKPPYHPHVFPDITVNGFGVEVKSNRQDSWQSVANSILETMRDPGAKQIYVVFGKMGGVPDVRWGRYETCIYHVRISHAPRFCLDLDMDDDAKSLFDTLNVSYDDFAVESPERKMSRVREYARGRLAAGERLWWLEDENHSFSLRVKRYNKLSLVEKTQLRAEAAILCPQICAPGTQRDKYDAAAHYLLTYHGVLNTRAKDMFSAGAVVLPANPERGGLYLPRALKAIEAEMREAAGNLNAAVLREYWERQRVPKKTEERLRIWLSMANKHARGTWKPSAILFKDVQ